MRVLLAFSLLLALVCSASALAARGEPQEKLNAADNGRARTIVLQNADLPGFRASPPGPRDGGPYCRALDESDLVLTGEAVSPDFSVGLTSLGSYADIYESVADMNASWRRGTSAAGEACLRQAIRSSLQGRFVSFERIALPRFAQRSVAWRIVWRAEGLRVFADLVAMQHSRAFAAITFASAAAPVTRKDVVRVARTVAARMKTAMRGA